METLLFSLICFVGCIYGKYNILFLQSDEMEGRVLDPSSPYWNIVEMPNLRSLASSGINFVNTYCNSPLCAPSRASMWAGRYVNNILAWSNSKSLAAQVEDPSKADPNCAQIIGYGEQWCIDMGKQQNVTTTIKQSMISAGYDAQLYGKTAFGAGMGGGFEGSNNGNWSTQSCIPSNHHYCTGEPIHAWTRGANLNASEWQRPWANSWINITAESGSAHAAHDQNVSNECIKYIDNYVKTNNKKPFLLYCSMIDPHPAYWTNSTWLKKLNYTALNASFDELISNFNGTFNNMHPADKYNSFSEGVGDVEIDTEWAYNLYRAYFATCAALDYKMGLIINKLKSYPDLYHNTLILYTSDHGELHLEHMQVEKMSLYEASARVPLIISGPNISPNQVINNFTTLVDIFPTFMDAANISYDNIIYPKNLNGYSLSPFFNWKWINSNKNNPYLKRPNYAFSEYHGDATNTGQFMLRQNQYKLIVYATNPPFQHYKPALFNIEFDPNELQNIADTNDKNKEIVKNMMNVLNGILSETGGGDYNFVDSKCQNEGKQNFLRWQTAIDTAGNNQSLWISYAQACYTNFNQNDIQRMENWMKSP
eukprot:417130_1